MLITSPVARLGLAGLGIFATASLWYWGFVSRYFADVAFLYMSFWILLAICLMWVMAFIRVMMSHWMEIRTHRHMLVWCAALSGVLAAAAPAAVRPAFRVLSDETNLISVSWSLAFQKMPRIVTMGEYYYGMFHPLQYEVPKRPIAYPFVVSVMHSIAGYRYQNAFVVNGLALFAYLMLISIIVSMAMSFWHAVLAVALSLSQPVLLLCAMSAGFEMFNLAVLTGIVVLVYLYCRKPSDELFRLLWMTLLFVAHVRYESIAFMPIIIAGLIITGMLRWQRIYSHVVFVGWTSLLLLPRLWQFVLSVGRYENGNDDVFDLARISTRLMDYVGAFVSFDHISPYSAPINLLGGLSVMAIVVWCCLKRGARNEPLIIAWWTAILTAGMVLIVVMSYYLADPMHPTVFRLYLIPVLAASLSIVGICRNVPSTMLAWIVMIACAWAICEVPRAGEHRLTQSLILVRGSNEIYDVLKRMDDNRMLLITDRPGQYTILRIGAVSFDYARRNWSAVRQKLDNGLYSRILVVEDVPYHSKSSSRADWDCKLSPIHSFQNSGQVRVVISEVIR